MEPKIRFSIASVQQFTGMAITGNGEIKRGELPVIFEGGHVVCFRGLYHIFERPHRYFSLSNADCNPPVVFVPTDAFITRTVIASYLPVHGALTACAFSQITSSIIQRIAIFVINKLVQTISDYFCVHRNDFETQLYPFGVGVGNRI